MTRSKVQPEEILEAARERGWVTLDELLEVASGSPVDGDEATELADELRLRLTQSEAEDDGWEDVRKLAREGEEAFEVSREARAPSEELAPGNPAAMYLREISRTPLLTAEEEVQLAKEREAGEAAKPKLAKGVADSGERSELEEAVRRGEAARKRLIESNLRLVVSVAKKFMGRGLSFLDLVQEGNIGLQKGVERYDWRKGFRFSTYAYWWIRQAVGRAVAEQGRTIRLPVHIIELLTKVYNTARELQAELGHPPSPEQIAERMGIETERVRDAFRAARMPISLATPIGADAEATLADFIADTAGRGPSELAEEEFLVENLDEALHEHLTPREADVLKLRFGLGAGRERTLGEVGQELGMSRERARQIEAEALRKLRVISPFRARFREYTE